MLTSSDPVASCLRLLFLKCLLLPAVLGLLTKCLLLPAVFTLTSKPCEPGVSKLLWHSLCADTWQ
eukprot:617616-Prorocentrum_lima.AAC.1